MSSFGDFIAVSDPVDMACARVIRREVSDGIIAPGYEPEALKILSGKRGGKYLVLEVDPGFEPSTDCEAREVFGVRLEQPRNQAMITAEMFGNVVTESRALPASAVRDLIVATIALKYTQSNSVCFAHDGQVVGLGAGQQSRIHCVRLAAAKADAWFLRKHPCVLDLPFASGTSRADMANVIDQFVTGEIGSWERSLLTEVPPPLTAQEKQEWLGSVTGVALSSDAFFPFRDNIDRAAKSGTSYVAEPGGSVRDDAVVAACNEHGMTLSFTGLRLFHH
jgi:phosphoribosylaminoimidazolecarboxamide formyltransferase/IMP cyclohydrolase